MLATEIWQRVVAKLELYWARSDCVTWLQGTRITGFNDGWVEITAPNSFAVQWLRQRSAAIQNELVAVLGYQLAGVRFVFAPPHYSSVGADRVLGAPASEEGTEGKEEEGGEEGDAFEIIEGWEPRRKAEKLPDIVWQRTEERTLQVEDPVFLLFLLYMWPSGQDVMYHIRAFLAECLGTTEKHIRGMEARLCQAHGFSSGNPLLKVRGGRPRKGYGIGYTMYSAFKPDSRLDRRDEWKFGHYDSIAHGFLLPYLRGRLRPSQQGIIPFFTLGSGPRLSLPAGGLYLYLLHLCRKMRIPQVMTASKQAPDGAGNGHRRQRPISCSRRFLLEKLGTNFYKAPRRDAWAELDRLGWVRSIPGEKRNTRPTLIINGPPATLLDLIGLAAATYHEEVPESFMEKWGTSIEGDQRAVQRVLEQVGNLGWRLTDEGEAAVVAEVKAIQAAL